MNALVVAAGVVENVCVDPKFPLLSTDAIAVELTLKSVKNAVVAPPAPETLIVHKIPLPTRAGFVLLHETADAVVGVPYTTNLDDPLVIVLPLFCTKIENELVVDAGVVENVYVAPKFALLNTEEATVDDTLKSPMYPVVSPLPPDTVIVHMITVDARAGFVLLHVTTDAVVGVP